MLFNSNIKLLIVLLLAVVLICMVNSKGEIPNMGEVEGLEVDDNTLVNNYNPTPISLTPEFIKEIQSI